MVLLDYPDSEGVTRELALGYPRLLARRGPLFAVGVSAVLVMGAIFGGRAVLRSAAAGTAPDIHLPLVPFPSADAGDSPPLAVSLRDNQLTPSAAPVPNTVSVPGAMPGAAPPVTPSPAAAGPRQAVAVKYQVVAQADGGYQFEAEVRVVNNGPSPISGWQITVALPHDQITAIGGADGYVSNHILLLQPAPSAGPLTAGGELSVSFVAQGPEMTPELCAFDDITCG